MIAPLLEFLGREHPAFVHLPLGTVLAMPLVLLMAHVSREPRAWKLAALFLAALAWLGSMAAVTSGLLWGRLINLIAPGALMPHVTGSGQVLQRLLQRHELAAVCGVALGAVTMASLVRALGRGGRLGLAVWLPVLLWLGSWGVCGRIGGILVFGDAETNRAAAAAAAARRADAEADLPIRALDYASLEPAGAAPVRSAAHGNRWARIWVTASAIDAYQADRRLPKGAYAVLATSEDAKGRPGADPGPLYFLETRSDGTPYFAFYWPRVPETMRKETGGEDSVYLRSPDPRLQSCQACHARR